MSLRKQEVSSSGSATSNRPPVLKYKEHHAGNRRRGERAPATCVQLDEAPGARESDGVDPWIEDHDNLAHFLDGANKYLLPPAVW